jgi:hypothetical protein
MYFTLLSSKRRKEIKVRNDIDADDIKWTLKAGNRSRKLKLTAVRNPPC